MPRSASKSMIYPKKNTSNKIVVTIVALSILGAASIAWWTLREKAALQEERERAAVAMKSLQAENERLRSLAAKSEAPATTAPTLNLAAREESVLEHWVEKISLLKKRLDAAPHLKIPEMQLLKAEDWIMIARGNNLETDADFREAAKQLRKLGKERFANQLVSALQAFSQTSGGKPPADLAQLLPYLQPPIDQTFIDRYRPNDTGKDAKGRPTFVVSERAVVDPDSDTLFDITPKGFTSRSTSMLRAAVENAEQSYRAANNNKKAGGPGDLLPYITDPALRKQYQDLMVKTGK